MRPASRAKSRAWPGPLYIDASALAKIYLPEPWSEELDRALEGRTDLLLSDLAVTEVVSAFARRTREGSVPPEAAARLRSTLLQDLESAVFERVELLPSVHREAEHLLLGLRSPALRAADALHLALAAERRAGAIVTFDERMAEAAARVGMTAVPDVRKA